MSEDAKTPPADQVIVDCDLDAPPERVWRALTEARLVAAWLLEGDTAARVECEILAVEVGRQVSYSWREAADEPGQAPRDSIVTFAISETPSGGAHLRLVHTAAPGRLEDRGEMHSPRPRFSRGRGWGEGVEPTQISLADPSLLGRTPHPTLASPRAGRGLVRRKPPTTMRWAA